MKKRIVLRAGLLITMLVILRLLSIPALPEPPLETSRFVKVDPKGTEIEENDGPWHCIKDNEQRLYWMVGRDDESPFDSYWTYSWYSSSLHIGEPHKGSCFYKTPGCNVSDIVAQANLQKVCGLSTWRLPTSQELLSLVQPPTKPEGPYIQSGFFPHTHKGDYWSSNAAEALTIKAFTHLNQGAVAVSFKDGTKRVLPYRNAAFVRLVANGKKT